MQHLFRVGFAGNLRFTLIAVNQTRLVSHALLALSDLYLAQNSYMFSQAIWSDFGMVQTHRAPKFIWAAFTCPEGIRAY